jgi:hypothetical protein
MSIAPKHAAKAFLGYTLEQRFCAEPEHDASVVTVPSPWDAWWARYRAAIPMQSLGVAVRFSASKCHGCRDQAMLLARKDPPGHPGTDHAGVCGCLQQWATMIRTPGSPAHWPVISLSFALIKPGGPWQQIASELAARYEVLSATQRTLTTADTLRLYPEAYGARYVRDRDAYLTSGPVWLLTLHARDPGSASSADVKAQIRRQLAAGVLRNHLHMPDNPGEALADIAQFTSHENLTSLYWRYERDRAAERLAFYRAALDIRQADADRDRAAG